MFLLLRKGSSAGTDFSEILEEFVSLVDLFGAINK
jgi:hypothetical protein